jgi:hypothetical protein
MRLKEVLMQELIASPSHKLEWCLKLFMKYSRHGKRRALERGISEDLILTAISKPTYSFYDLGSSVFVVLRKLDGKHLLVAYAMEGNEMRVVTTFITSTAQEIIDAKLKGNVWVKIK